MTSWVVAHQASLYLTISWNLSKFMSIELVLLFNQFIFCHLLLLPSIFLSIMVFFSEATVCIRWSKYWSFNFSISSSNEFIGSGFISFRIYLFDFLAVQVTLKSLHEQQNSEASILQCSAIFMVQIANSYMTTGKTIA